jgi:hypothetical protein
MERKRGKGVRYRIFILKRAHSLDLGDGRRRRRRHCANRSAGPLLRNLIVSCKNGGLNCVELL